MPVVDESNIAGPLQVSSSHSICRARPAVHAAVLLAAFLVAGCVGPASWTGSLTGDRKPVRVLVMPPDIQVAQMSALGLMLPVARWTRDARKNVESVVGKILEDRELRRVPYREPAAAKHRQTVAQLTKLHRAVGRSIMRHTTGGRDKLPTKGKDARWSLGEKARVLGRIFDADYALFLRVRDSYTSPGRVFQIAFIFIRSGFVMPGGRLNGYGSLVDLKTGDIVWFSPFASDQGDLRDTELADRTVRDLLAEFPQ